MNEDSNNPPYIKQSLHLNKTTEKEYSMDILELLHYTFFQHALLGSLFASIACGIIGTYIVTRRLVFISGGITHASLEVSV